MSERDEPVHVLHVDDNPEFADLTATCLERENDRFVVTTAHDASEGLEKLAEAQFDCIVSDYDMPGQNGIALLESVREQYPDMPFILYTGKGSEAVASDAISAGVTEYMQKESGTGQYTILANRIVNSVEQHRSEQIVRETKERLQQLTENTTDCLWMFTPDWDELLFISGYEKVFNRPTEQIKNNPKDFLEAIDPEYLDDARQAMDRVADGESIDQIFKIWGKNDESKWVWVKGEPIFDEADEVVRVVGFTRDITDHQEHYKQLQQYETIVEALSDAVYVLDEKGRFVYVNDEFVEMVGYERETILGSDPSLIKDESAVQTAEEQLGRLLSSEGPDDVTFEVTIQPREGDPIVCEDHMGVLPYEGDRFEGSVGTLRDVTKRNEQEQELKDRTEELERLTTDLEEQYRNLFEEAPVMAVVTRAEDGRPIIEDCNDLFVETLDYEKPDVVGEELAAFYTPESQRKLLDDGGYDRALSGEFVRESRELVTADGETVETLLRAVPREDTNEDSRGTLAFYIDISERKRLERQRNRLEEFTGIVSHDLRSPLSVAEGNIELAQKECNSDHLARAADAIDRSQALIDDLLRLAREGDDVTESDPVDLADVAQHSWETVETRQARLETDATGIVQADRSRLQQLFEDVYRNAVEHGGDGVTVHVGDLDDGFYVADTGSGIPESDEDEIFEAGFSTADDGTGFGLRIVEQIVEAHGWEIRATESEQGGARLEVSDVERV